MKNIVIAALTILTAGSAFAQPGKRSSIKNSGSHALIKSPILHGLRYDRRD
jgi:hypothetical protein